MPSHTTHAVVRLLRPRQWTKALVCFAGVFFSGGMLKGHNTLRACIVALAFCAISSAVYAVNDILDRDRDRNHPKKRFRPIASEQISVRLGLIIAVILGALAMALGSLLSPVIVSILAAYALLNICYSAVLKNLSLVDATVVASGFILRIYAGTMAVNVSPSAWLLLCTFFLSLFLAFGKRRAEINAAMGKGPAGQIAGEPALDVTATRSVLHKYNVSMLDRFSSICATLTIASYAMFTVLGHANKTLIITVPPVVMGIFRYLLLVERYDVGEAPDEILLRDWAIQLAVALWAILYIAVLYLGLNVDVQ